MPEHSVSEQQELAAELASGLRHVADFIKANPEFAEWFRYTLAVAAINLHLTDEEDQAAALGRFSRAVLRNGGTVDKKIDDQWYTVVASFGAVKAETLTYRNQVCEAVVVGQETVKIRKPPPKDEWAEVEETRDIVKYECKPLLEQVTP
jgi:hypothetical protein